MSAIMRQAFEASKNKVTVVTTSNPKSNIVKSLFYPRIVSQTKLNGQKLYFNLCRFEFTISDLLNDSLTHFSFNQRTYQVLSCGLDCVATCENISTGEKTIFHFTKKVVPLFLLPSFTVPLQSSLF